MIKRLFFDIETSPCLGWFWRPSQKTSIGYHQILEQAKIICICYKWSTSDKIYSLQWDSNQCDKAMIKKFVEIMKLADEIVGHNSDKFDVKWIRTRAMFHRIQMMPDFTSVDTLKEARKGFNFPSNRLDAICRYLGIGEKIKTTEELWMDIWRKKSKKAMAEMIRYCKRDVLVLEEYFKLLNKYIKPKSSIAFNYKCDCPECGSEETKINQTRYSATGVKKYSIICQSCFKQFTKSAKQFDKEKKLQQASRKNQYSL